MQPYATSRVFPPRNLNYVKVPKYGDATSSNQQPKLHNTFTMLLATFFLLFAPLLVSAQFGFFEQMFQGGGSSGGGGRQQQERNVPSNSDWYKRMYNDGMALFYPHELGETDTDDQ
jgi:hypothetical protein